jgi:hypothetical protein
MMPFNVWYERIPLDIHNADACVQSLFLYARKCAVSIQYQALSAYTWYFADQSCAEGEPVGGTETLLLEQ